MSLTNVGLQNFKKKITKLTGSWNGYFTMEVVLIGAENKGDF